MDNIKNTEHIILSGSEEKEIHNDIKINEENNDLKIMKNENENENKITMQIEEIKNSPKKEYDKKIKIINDNTYLEE